MSGGSRLADGTLAQLVRESLLTGHKRSERRLLSPRARHGLVAGSTVRWKIALFLAQVPNGRKV